MDTRALHREICSWQSCVYVSSFALFIFRVSVCLLSTSPLPQKAFFFFFITFSEPWRKRAINLQIIESVQGSRWVFSTATFNVLRGHTHAHTNPLCCEPSSVGARLEFKKSSFLPTCSTLSPKPQSVITFTFLNPRRWG